MATWLLAVGILAGAGASGARAGSLVDASEASRLPSGTLVFASIAGLDTLHAQLQETGLWKIAHKLPMVPVMAQQGWEDFVQEFERESGLAFQDVWDLLSGRLTLALVDLDPEAVMQGAPPGVLLRLDLGGHEEAWKRVVEEQLLPMLDQQLEAQGGQRSESQWQGSTLHSLSFQDVPYGHAIVHEGQLVVSTKKGLLEGYFQPPAETLQADAGFQWVREHLAPEGILMAYADLGGLWKRIEPMVPKEDPEVQMGLAMLGLDGLSSVGLSTQVTRGGFLDRFVLGYGEAGGGVVQLLRELKPGPVRSLELAPKNSVLYMGSRFSGSLAELFGKVREHVLSHLPEEAMKELDEGLAEFRTNVGLDLEKDVLAKLSGELGLSLAVPELPTALLDNPMAALGKLNEVHLALYLGAEDGEALDGLISSTLEKFGVTASSEESQGMAYRLVPVPYAPVMPGYAVVGKHIVIGLNAGTLTKAIELGKSGGGLASSERYRKAMEVLSIEEPSSVSYLDTPGIALTGLRFGLAYLKKAKASGEPLPVDPESLPSMEEIAELVPPLVSAGRMDERGIASQSFGPVGAVVQTILSGAGQAMAERHHWEEPEPPEAVEPMEEESAEEAVEPMEEESAEEAVEPMEEESAEVAVAVPEEEPEPAAPRKAPPAPEGWNITSRSETVVSYSSGDYQGTATWLRTPYSPYMKLEAMIEQVKSASSSTPGFEVLREGPVDWGALEGWELEYEMGPEKGRQKLHMLYLQDGTHLYTLTLQCAAPKCEGYQGAFDAIMGSLQ